MLGKRLKKKRERRRRQKKKKKKKGVGWFLWFSWTSWKNLSKWFWKKNGQLWEKKRGQPMILNVFFIPYHLIPQKKHSSCDRAFSLFFFLLFYFLSVLSLYPSVPVTISGSVFYLPFSVFISDHVSVSIPFCLSVSFLSVFTNVWLSVCLFVC